MQKLGGRFASFCKFWWGIISANILEGIFVLLHDHQLKVKSAKILKVRSASRGMTSANGQIGNFGLRNHLGRGGGQGVS